MPLPTSIPDLASALGLTIKQLNYWGFVAPSTEKYKFFEVPKSSGSVRKIMAPRPPLRAIQRRLLRLLEPCYLPRYSVHGFVADRSILTNASIHAKRKWILNVDLENFFPNINFGRVRGALMTKMFGAPPNVATVIANLACNDNQLPQGAPTSPILANIVCWRLDRDITQLARTNACFYTRYADDLTISTNRSMFPPVLATANLPPFGTAAIVGELLRTTIQNNGFKISESKVRLAGRSNSQQVTGLVCNQFINVPRTAVRQVRAMIHAARKFGIEAAESEFHLKKYGRHRNPGRPPGKYVRVLRGKLEFIAMVRGRADPVFIKLAKAARELAPGFFPVVLDAQELIRESVWILESEKTGAQGTGFMLDGVGLVTCDHVLADDTVVFHVSNPGKHYAAEPIVRDEHLDLAILKPPVENAHALTRGDPRLIVKHSKVLLVGFPDYGPGNDEAFEEWGTISVRQSRFGVRYFVPTIKIGKGNSGGPLLDERYRVVGVAARGAKPKPENEPDEPNEYMAAAIDQIDLLIPK